MIDHGQTMVDHGLTMILLQGEQASKDRLMSGKQCQSFLPGLEGREGCGRNDTKCAVQNMESCRFFPGSFRRGRDLSPHMEGQKYNGGTLEGGHRHYGGPNFDRLYHTLKVLLLLLLLCISQLKA